MPTHRLLAIDIDGTLVNSRNELSPATRAALGEAVAAGMAVVLATGRRYSRALPLVEPLGLDVPVVTASGALVKHPRDHRTLFRAEFIDGTLQGMLQVVGAAGYEALLYTDMFEQGFEFYCTRLDYQQPELAEWMAANSAFGRVIPQLMRQPPTGIFAGFAMGPREEMLQLERRLQAALPGQLATHVLRSPLYQGYMCEIAPFGIDKWSAIQRLAAEWGIADEEICAVGDDVNDIPMIRAAGLGIAMGNAAEIVRQAADRVAPEHDEDGLVTVVRWLLDER